MHPKAPAALFFLSLLFSVFLLQPSEIFAQSNTSTIRVCKVLADPDGNIVTGAEQPGTVFRQRWFAPNTSLLASGFRAASSVPKEAVFTTPLTLNTLLPNIPAGPNGLNAQCITDYPRIGWNYNSGGRDFAQIYYDRVPTPNGFWQPIKYHDGWVGSQTLQTIDVYYDNIFDGNTNNDAESQRNGNADGHVCLGECGSVTHLNRTLMIYTRYSRHLTPRPTSTPTRTPTPRPTTTPTRTPAPTISNGPKNSIRVCQVIANPDGSITTGAEQPNKQFRFQWFNPDRNMLSPEHELASVVPPEAVFTTPLTLNTLLPNIPAGPNGLNAQCKDDYSPITLNYREGNTPYANLFYRRIPDPSGEWAPIKYHDGYAGSQTLTTLGEYDNKLFDGNSNNDDNSDRNLNADGHVNLREGSKRTILIYSKYKFFIDPDSCDGDCNTFSAGHRESFDNLTKNNITVNDPNVWTKITVDGRNENNQTITVNHTLNTSHFQFDNPESLIEVRRTGNNTSNITNNCRTDSSGCTVTYNASTGTVTIQLPAITDQSSYSIFLKIVPTNTSSTPVNVNNNSQSYIRYNDGYRETLRNDTLVIGAPTTSNAYYTIQKGGNVYSASRITSNLPSSASFYESGHGILQRTSTLSTGAGSFASSSAQAHNVQYSPISNSPIDQLISDISQEATATNNPIVRTVSGSTIFLENKPYVYNGDLRINYPINLSAAGSQQLIIVVKGDLIIEEDIIIPDNGREGIVFIVEKNIIIRPTVENLHGIFISKEKFFSACGGSVISGQCAGTTINLNTNLTVQGAVISKGGLNLARQGSDSNRKAETFIYRPDLILSASSIAGYSNYLWQEIEP